MASPVINAAIDTFQKQKHLAERAMEQVSDTHLHDSLAADTNSIAVIVKHLAGNMRSRWTDFLTSDGEKSWRNRDREFIDDLQSRAEILRVWEDGWQCLFNALHPLCDEDLQREIRIRGEPHTVILAILRQIDHYGYHIGQIVLVARLLAGERWQSLSIPRGESEAYNQRVWQGERPRETPVD